MVADIACANVYSSITAAFDYSLFIFDLYYKNYIYAC
jgi:hypothetical protein